MGPYAGVDNNSPYLRSKRPNPKKGLTGGKSCLWHKVKVDSGIGFPIVNVLESTLEWT